MQASGAAVPTDEDGHELWLRYREWPAAARAALRRHTAALWLPARPSALLRSAAAELQRGLGGFTGRALRILERDEAWPAGTVALATPRSWPALRGLGLPLQGLGDEGYLLRTLKLGGKTATLVAALNDRGLLYGTFALLRHLATGGDIGTLNERSVPALPLRMLNHWDNLDRTVERGYAGFSIWDWWKLPHIVDARYTDYARANASLGINGVSLNNVNAKPEILSAPFIAKAAALADVLRPWAQRVFLAVRFSSPKELGGLPTADPLDAAVARWWQAKVDEIVRAIPDFGGFIVKANSEGQPGPQDYGRNHAEGANVIARALAPHGARVIWRAFVYDPENHADRARQAYEQFVPLDGSFEPNVIVQVKNGAIDFQPREPFHPLFGAMPNTAMMGEFMVTKEYMGFSTHLAYQGTVFEETLQSDTHRPSKGTPVAHTLAGMAGVANVGTDRNWCGSPLEQANWYAFGRLAWAPLASSAGIADEWVRQSFGHEPRVVKTLNTMLAESREAVVNYMTPLGLHHLMDTGHHHGPGPWVGDLPRADWNPTYYHQADQAGIGFDRSARGSNAVSQYAEPLAARWNEPATTPPELLLWFHHLPWEHKLAGGRTLWQELVARYDAGVATVASWQRRWAKLAGLIDARRHHEVAQHLAQQLREAQWWRGACLAYFQHVNGRALPKGRVKPAKSLAEYRALRFPFAPGRGG